MNTKKWVAWLTICLLPSFGMAQLNIHGTVRDQHGEKVVGANIYVENTYDGASSDTAGSFRFQTTPADSVVLVGSFIGHKSYRQIYILQSDTLFVHVLLPEITSRLHEVVITAGTFKSGSNRRSEILRPLDIVTTAGATADIAGALNTLPGTQIVGEQGRLFVRGGDGHETQTYIDGMLVRDAYDLSPTNVPTRSRFSPFMFSGTQFSTGGYSAEYGQGLSSALILDTKETASETRTDLSLISVGLESAHTHAWDRASMAAKAGYYDLNPYFRVIEQDIDWIKPPTSFDGNVAYRQQIGRDGLLKSYGKFSSSAMILNQDGPATSGSSLRTTLDNQYGYLNASYKDLLSDQWTIRGGISHTNNRDHINLNQHTIKENTQSWHGKIVTGFQYNRHIFLRMGAEIITHRNKQGVMESKQAGRTEQGFSESILSSFLETEYYLSPQLVMRLGGRIESNTLQRKTAIDPRFSLAFKTGTHGQLSLAFGQFRQSVLPKFLRLDMKLQSEKALHYILNYQWILNNRTFRLEAFYKKYQQLVTFDPPFPFEFSSYANDGTGYAKGIDLFYRDAESIPNVDFWLSYSFLDTRREYLDYPIEARPTFTSMHNFTAVYKHFINLLRSQIGLTYAYASGRPYHDPNFPGFNAKVTPAYHDLSCNISYLATSQIIVYLSATNLFNRKNIFGYRFHSQPDDQGTYQGEPIKLPAPRFLLAGVFITLSKSKSVNQLPHL